MSKYQSVNEFNTKIFVVVMVVLLLLALTAEWAVSEELGCWKETGKEYCSGLGVTCLLNPDELKYNYQFYGGTVGYLCDIMALLATGYGIQAVEIDRLRDKVGEEKRNFRRLARRCKIVREQ